MDIRGHAPGHRPRICRKPVARPSARHRRSLQTRGDRQGRRDWLRSCSSRGHEAPHCSSRTRHRARRLRWRVHHLRTGRRRASTGEAVTPRRAGADSRRHTATGHGSVGRRLRRPLAHVGRRAGNSPEGRQRVRCRRRLGARRRRHRTGSVQPWRRVADPRLPGQGREGDVDRRPGLGAEGRHARVLPVTRQEARRGRPQPGRHSRGACRRAHDAREMGHDELRAGGGPRHRLRGERLSDPPAHPRHRAAQPRVLQVVARQPEGTG